MLLSVYAAWEKSNFSNNWCHDNFIQARSIKQAQNIRKQLLGICDRYRMEIRTCGKEWVKIKLSIASGFFRNACKKDPQEGYKTIVDGNPVYIHPSSCLFQKKPEWILYHELVMTTKEYARNVMSIDPNWLVQVAPNFFNKVGADEMSNRKRNEKIVPLFNRFQEPDAWRLSKRFGGRR